MKDISEKIAAKDIEGRGLSKNDFTDDYRYSLTSLIKYVDPTLVPFPLGLTWNAIKYPVGDIKLLDSVGPTRTRGYMQKSAQELFDEHSTARYNPGATFYVQPAGSDSADGLTPETALRSISKAVTKANDGGVPTLIYIQSGVYHKTINPCYNTTTGGSIIPSVDIAFVNRPNPNIATIQRVLTGVFEGEASFNWSVDGGFTNCHSATLSGSDQFERVLDLNSYNEFGNWKEFNYVANPTLCNATPGTWTNEGSKIYTHRLDKKAVAHGNTRVYRSGAYTFRFTNPGINIYMEGIDCEGGGVTQANGLGGAAFNVNILFPNSKVKQVFVVNNCSFKYSGGRVNTANTGVGFHQCNGFMALYNCRSDANMTDGFNAHNLAGEHNAELPHFLTVNCSAFDNGRQGNYSSNAWTMHDNVIGVDISGYYKHNHGGSVRNIGSSKTFILGTYVESDLGDRYSSSSSLFPVAYMCDDIAEMWVDSAKANMPSSTNNFFANGTAIMYLNNVWP